LKLGLTVKQVEKSHLMLTLTSYELKPFFAFRSNLMKQILMIMAVSFIIVLMGLGCGSKNQLATEIIYDAKVQVEAAKAANAQDLASQELTDAEQMLARSKEVLDAGREKEAYRLGMRAHLKAKVAEAVAVANQMEAEASSSEGASELKLQAAEAAHRDLQEAEEGLKQLLSTPEE
jgi:capsular polysaccharide biosynthesis protein